MGRLETKSHQASRRKQRVRSKVSGTAEKPRLSVKVTNRHIVAQLVDDSVSQTLVYVNTTDDKQIAAKSLSEKAEWVGSEIAKLAKSKKIKTAVLDRGSKLYHGRVAKLADTARKQGLEI